MSKSTTNEVTVQGLLKRIVELRAALHDYKGAHAVGKATRALTRRFVAEAGRLVGELQRARERTSPVHFGPIGITLG